MINTPPPFPSFSPQCSSGSGSCHRTAPASEPPCWPILSLPVSQIDGMLAALQIPRRSRLVDLVRRGRERGGRKRGGSRCDGPQFARRHFPLSSARGCQTNGRASSNYLRRERSASFPLYPRRELIKNRKPRTPEEGEERGKGGSLCTSIGNRGYKVLLPLISLQNLPRHPRDVKHFDPTELLPLLCTKT